MTLQFLVESYRKKEIIPDQEPSSIKVDRAESVYDLSVLRNIPTNEADAEILVGELLNYAKGVEANQSYMEADELVDVFDPIEPPRDGKGIVDPRLDILKAEIAVIREPIKWGLKAAGYIFSPIDRSFKFLTNATMFEPFTKSMAGPVRWAILSNLENIASSHIAEAKLEELRQELLEKHGGQEHRGPFIREFKERSIEIRKQAREQAREALPGIIAAEKEAIAELPQVKAGDISESAVNALKALVPWPGFADDVKTRGEISADSYERIVGREAPWYYASLTDMAEQTVALAGLTKIAISADLTKDAASIAAAAKLTKQEIRAIKRLHKAASKITKLPVRAEGVPSPTAAATVTQKLIRLLKEAKPLRDKKALLVHKENQRKAAKLAQVQKNVRGEQLVRSTKRALKGKSPTPDFTPIGTDLSTQEIDVLFNLVNNSQLGAGFDKGRAILSLDKLLKGTLITKSEIANLEAVFGKALARALFMKQNISSIIQDISFEVINLPRAMLASFDLSAAGRQGIIFSVADPDVFIKSFGRSVRAAVSLKYSDEIERATKASRFGKLADKFGIHSSPTGFTARLSAKEELFTSRLAEKIPGIAQSERAFTTFLNQMRREKFAKQAKKWIAKGITPENNPKSYQQLAKFINHATGRGSLENLQPGALTALNAVFFSPRFQISRVQVIGDLISPKTTWHARKVIARDLAKFYATGMGIMAMAEMAGAEVEKDPRSSDFGKIKVGNTRYNYWGAFQPMASLAGRIYSGEIKSTGTGKIKKKDRISLGIDNTIISFMRTKLSPVSGRIFDVIAGETILGDPVEPTVEFVSKTAYESLVPLFIQDSVDAWRFQGIDAQFPLSAGLAFIGIGVQTWELAPFAQLELARDSLARQTYGKNYDELSFMEVNVLDTDILINYPGISAMEQEAKFNSNSVNFIRDQLLDLRKSERFIKKKLNKKLLEDLNEAKISIGGVDRVFGNWRLNDEQYKEYQEKVAKNINELFKDMRPVWDTKDDDSFARVEIINRILRSAKQLAAQEMKIGSME